MAGAASGLQHSKRPVVSADSSGATLSLRFLQRQQGWRLQPALVSRAALELGPICASVCPETAWEGAVAIVLLKDALRRQRCDTPAASSAAAAPQRSLASLNVQSMVAPVGCSGVAVSGTGCGRSQEAAARYAKSCVTEEAAPRTTAHKDGDMQALGTARMGGQLLLHVRVLLADSRLSAYQDGTGCSPCILALSVGSSVLEGASAGLPYAEGGGSTSAGATPLPRAATLDGTDGMQQGRRTGVHTPVSAAAWLQHSPGRGLGAVSWHLTLGPLTAAIPSHVLVADEGHLDGLPSTSLEQQTPIERRPSEGCSLAEAAAGLQQVLQIAQLTAEIIPAERCRADSGAMSPLLLKGAIIQVPECKGKRRIRLGPFSGVTYPVELKHSATGAAAHLNEALES